MRPAEYLVASFASWVCMNHGASVTSWWRTRKRNDSPELRARGSVPNSRHLTGEAVDLAYDGEPPELVELQKVASSFFCRVIREKDHDHVESILRGWPIASPEANRPVDPGGTTPPRTLGAAYASAARAFEQHGGFPVREIRLCGRTALCMQEDGHLGRCDPQGRL